MTLTLRWLAYVLIALGAVLFAGSYVGAYLRGGMFAVMERWVNPFSDLLLLVLCLGPGVALLGWASKRGATKAMPRKPDREPFQLTPTMPDITKRQPARAFQAETCMIFFLRDVPSVVAHATYPLVMAAISIETRRPLYFVTLERSQAGQFLCGFASDGSHHNFGLVQISEGEFVSRAMSILRAQCPLGSIQEMRRRE